MSARRLGNGPEDDEREIGPSSSKKSSSDCFSYDFKKSTPMSTREGEKKTSNSRETEKSVDDKIGDSLNSNENDWETVCVKTVMDDRTIDERAPIPKKSFSSSASSADAKNRRKKIPSRSPVEGQKRTGTSSSSLDLVNSGRKLLSSTRVKDRSVTSSKSVAEEKSKIGWKSKITSKIGDDSRDRQSSVKKSFSSSSSLDAPSSRRILPSWTRVKDRSATKSKNVGEENSKIGWKNKISSKIGDDSRDRQSSVNKSFSSSSSLDAPNSRRILPSSPRVKDRSARKSKNVAEEKSKIGWKSKILSKIDDDSRDRQWSVKKSFSSSSSLDVANAKNIFSSTIIKKKTPTTGAKKSRRDDDRQMEFVERSAIDEVVEDRDVQKKAHDMADKRSWEEKKNSEILEKSKNFENFNRDAEVTREALPSTLDIDDLEEPLLPRERHLGLPESPKERENIVEYVEVTNLELPDIDPSIGLPIIEASRFDDDSVDRGDSESGEMRVRRDNLRTYPPATQNVIYIGTRVPRILKRPHDVLRMFERSPVVVPPGQTPPPAKIKFHPADNYRANKLWDEFVSNNPDLFARNVSSRPPETNRGETTTQNRFFTRNRNLSLDDVETQEIPIKKRKKRKTKRRRAIKSSSSSPEMVCVRGRLPAKIDDLDDPNSLICDTDVYDNMSERNNHCKSPIKKIVRQNRRSPTARDRYDRSGAEIGESPEEVSIEDLPYRPRSRSRSPSRRRRELRTDEAPNAEDRRRSRRRSTRKIYEASGSKKSAEDDERRRRTRSSSVSRDSSEASPNSSKNRSTSDSVKSAPIDRRRSANTVPDETFVTTRRVRRFTRTAVESPLGKESEDRHRRAYDRSSESSTDRDYRPLVSQSKKKSSLGESRRLTRGNRESSRLKDTTTTRISSSRSCVPMIRSDVDCTAGRVRRVGDDRWKIDLSSLHRIDQT